MGLLPQPLQQWVHTWREQKSRLKRLGESRRMDRMSYVSLESLENRLCLSVEPLMTFTGNIGVSTDALGTTDQGILQAEIPAGSTIEAAYLHVGNVGVWGAPHTQVSFDGELVDLIDIAHVDPAGMVQFSVGRADVTDIVSDHVGTSGGIFDFVVDETATGDPLLIEGTSLTVVYSNAGLPEQTVIVMDGGLTSTSSTNVYLGQSVDTSDTDFVAELRLGIQYGYNGGGYQYSVVDVNGQRLTSSAGDYDDGNNMGENGTLITLGGIGDSTANPMNPYDTTSPDDELYDLTPFLSHGDTVIQVDTDNPSRDDSLFLMVFTISGTASLDPIPVEDPPLDDPVDEDPMDEDPMDEDPVEEDPTEEDPVVEDPVEDDPVIEDPVIEDPIEEEPVVEDPILEEEPVEDEPPVVEEEEETPVVETPPVFEEPPQEENVVDPVDEPIEQIELYGEYFYDEGFPFQETPGTSSTLVTIESGTPRMDYFVEEPINEQPVLDDGPGEHLSNQARWLLTLDQISGTEGRIVRRVLTLRSEQGQATDGLLSNLPSGWYRVSIYAEDHITYEFHSENIDLLPRALFDQIWNFTDLQDQLRDIFELPVEQVERVGPIIKPIKIQLPPEAPPTGSAAQNDPVKAEGEDLWEKSAASEKEEVSDLDNAWAIGGISAVAGATILRELAKSRSKRQWKEEIDELMSVLNN
ncbi:Hypothetical protein PBC10988_33420 [Planctomycetales bacterium 10988]|nr:Hypothetical protein PBC10988_33420 [Planctomycetales bacterium 10988]